MLGFLSTLHSPANGRVSRAWGVPGTSRGVPIHAGQSLEFSTYYRVTIHLTLTQNIQIKSQLVFVVWRENCQI